MIQRIVFTLALSLLIASPIYAYMNFELSDSSYSLPANSVIDLLHDGSAVWIASSGGVGKSVDGGLTWVKYGADDSLGSESSSGLAVTPDFVWAATSTSEVQEGESIPIGTGLSKTSDSGANWSLYTPNQASYYGKIAYDLAITDSTVWAACFYGGLIRNFGSDSTFYNVFPDSSTRAHFDSTAQENPNSGGFATTLGGRFFSVKADTSHADTTVIFGGSAAGVYRFIFTAYDTIPDTVYQAAYSDPLLNVEQWLPGNFVISLGVQYVDDGSVIWAGCKPASAGGYIAISRSDDNGLTWGTSEASYGFECWNFAFDDTIVYAATSDGLIRSFDHGRSWNNMRPTGGYVDSNNSHLYLSDTFYAAAIVGDTIWAGGPGGVIRSTDDGLTWRVFRSYPGGDEGAEYSEAGDSYAYPVPFRPREGASFVRIHYRSPATTKATIKIYDFGLNLVKTVTQNKSVMAGTEYDNDIWNGRNGEGELAANGVYFYRIEFADGTDWWGKLAVVK